MTQMPPPRGHPHTHAGILQKMKLKKGHNSHNNWPILPQIELDLYFMIIYLCIKYEANTPIFFKKNIERKTVFEGKTGP